MFKNVQFEGYTTKRAVQVTTIANPAKATDPTAEDLSFALITLMQDRDYKVVVKKPDGSIEFEADGTTPKRDFPTDALTLKFRNGSSKALAQYKKEGVSRKLQGVGHLETFQTKETYVMVKGADGKMVRRDLFYWAPDPKNPAGPQVKVPIEHYVDHTVIVVDEWRFGDANPDKKAEESSVPAGITADNEAGLDMGGFAPASAEAATAGEGVPAALQGSELPPLTTENGAPQPEF